MLTKATIHSLYVSADGCAASGVGQILSASGDKDLNTSEDNLPRGVSVKFHVFTPLIVLTGAENTNNGPQVARNCL